MSISPLPILMDQKIAISILVQRLIDRSSIFDLTTLLAPLQLLTSESNRAQNLVFAYAVDCEDVRDSCVCGFATAHRHHVLMIQFLGKSRKSTMNSPTYIRERCHGCLFVKIDKKISSASQIRNGVVSWPIMASGDRFPQWEISEMLPFRFLLWKLVTKSHN